MTPNNAPYRGRVIKIIIEDTFGGNCNHNGSFSDFFFLLGHNRFHVAHIKVCIMDSYETSSSKLLILFSFTYSPLCILKLICAFLIYIELFS